ncbi:DUF2231 domain-containing protein [Prescottella subtropica]|uniref:DUF2231 domain-containing protein n=1 Tax=Prescottella subtropica TaxID=2545757 RepID=UPI0010F59529|nr:DUF2231 domain-containing protein [Prescottella subtropica]
MNLRHLFERAESASSLDGVADALAHLVQSGPGRTPVAAGLRGGWLGHPVHPVLVAIPIGAWTSSLVLDVVFRDHRAARRLLGIGLVTVPATAGTGWLDWSERGVRQRRVGLIHAGANVVGIVLTFASFRRRRRDPDAFDPLATALSATALTAVGVGGALGGHLVFAEGSGMSAATESTGPAFDPALADLDAMRTPRDGHRHRVLPGHR